MVAGSPFGEERRPDQIDPRFRWQKPFTRQEALAMWSRLVAGWVHSLDETGARMVIDGITLPNLPDQGGSFEGVTRMMLGLGGWLSQANRPVTVTWHGETYDLAALMKRALVTGCNPKSPGCWGSELTSGTWDQRTVEAGNVMFNVWQARDKVWLTMTPEEQEMIVRFHELYGQKPDRWNNNWALFWLMNHASRKTLGQTYDQTVIDSVLDDYLDDVYCGDGWYDDAPKRGAQQFDDYNWLVFGTYLLWWAYMDGNSRPDRRAVFLERIRALMRHYPFFFAANGAYTEFGRSLTYKFARLGVALWSYRLGVWPHSVGMLKRLVGRHLRWYFDRGGVAANGTLIQPITYEASKSVRDPYNATGSPYWAMQAFNGLWSLADDDPFWTADEELLPVEQGDFIRVLPQPGWVLVGTGKTGGIQRFNAGSTHLPFWDYTAKYDKFVYSTIAPFNAGLVDGVPSPDAMLSLTDGRRYGHRTRNIAFAVGEPGWLRMRYAQEIGRSMHTIDTTIICRGEGHLRAHRVMLDPEASSRVSAVEGAAALGYSPGMSPQLTIDEQRGMAIASVSRWIDPAPFGRCVAIRSIRGYDGQSITSAWGGHTDLNSVYGAFVLPMLSVSRLQAIHELVCIVHIGSESAAESLALADEIADVHWQTDGTFQLTWRDGASLKISGKLAWGRRLEEIRHRIGYWLYTH